MCSEIFILLEAEKDVEVELLVSYVVTNARWSPKYDIRVFGNDKQMKVSMCLDDHSCLL